MNHRELKFRVWDIESKTWCELECVIGSNYDIVNDPDKFIIQQFTELYDKNKKPIYEGDRVRFGYTGKVDFFGEVIWLEDRASFGVRTGNAFETFEDLMDYMKYFEVVGNIFQLPCNPDHNGECLVCDCWLSDCQFLNKNEQQNYEKL
jgi:hypothetical protein